MNLNKVDISHCINQNLIDDTVLCLLCKGIVIDPFKWTKCFQLYWKEWLDYILENDICKDGSRGCISYRNFIKIIIFIFNCQNFINTVRNNLIKLKKDKTLFINCDCIAIACIYYFKTSYIKSEANSELMTSRSKQM